MTAFPLHFVHRFLWILLLFVIVPAAEGIFFHSPKGVLMNLIETLGGFKGPNPVHHYHMHYYPMPMLMPKPMPPPPPPPHPPPAPKIEIDLHSGLDAYGSQGWANREYGKLYDADVGASPNHAAESPWTMTIPQQKLNGWENNELEKDHAYKEAKPQGILLQVPLHQQIVLYQPPAKSTSTSLLSIFLRKLRRLNNALLHPEEETTNHQPEKPHISNVLTYGGGQ